LTQRLAERITEVIDLAIDLQSAERNVEIKRDLARFKKNISSLSRVESPSNPSVAASDGDWVATVASGERAMYRNDDGCQEVTVIGHRYTPRGLMLELAPIRAGTSWMVAAQCIEPINGITRLIRLNLMTGASEALPGDIAQTALGR
jgi:hypothetical protein